MHVSPLLLPLLLALPAAQAATRHGSAVKRHPAAHNVPDLERVRREATAAMEKKEGYVGRSPLAGGKKGKRLVRKKRDTGCQDAFTVNATASATATSPSTTASLGANATSPINATDYSAGASDSFTASDSYTASDSFTASVTDSSSSVDPTATATTAIGGEAYAQAGSSSSSSTSGKHHKSSSSSASASATNSSSSTEAWATTTSSADWESASSTGESASSTATSSSAAASSTSAWTLLDTISGSNFFDSEYWSFWDYTDPTGGTVNYVDSSTAWNDGLVSINSDGRAIMKVDTTETVSSLRNSVRLHNTRVWTGGMVLMDAYHVPTGCGTWPAWWQNGPNWPEGGEIDIVEGINEFTQNQVSLHTGVGCTMPSDLNSNQQGTLTTGSYNSYDCSSDDTSNQGCGVRDEVSDNSYGSSFNSISGGVYAMVWDKDGIAVWFFPRSSIPSDITNDSPDHTTWGTPIAKFPSTDCSPYEFFYDHFNIFDTTLCGDWAGADSVWNYAGYAGQDQSCASLTGYSSCSDYVLNSGSSFSEAYWEVSYVKYFNSTTYV